MAPLRYLTPFIFLALVVLGAWLGGAWTFLAAAATPFGLMGLDVLLGKEGAGVPAEHRSGPRWFPRIYILVQLATTAWVVWLVARAELTLLETAGLVASVGVTTGVFGFVAAHEMIHSPDRRERALGLTLLGTVLYMHFRIAHVYGHHRRAATADDPATARLGEGLYAFLPRTVAGQFREAWQFEAQRLRRIGRPVLTSDNRMIRYLTIEALLLIVVALVGLRALVFLLAVAALSIALLETFNYVAHYGLSRRVDTRGRAERLAPQHSWNSGRRMNNAALFNMGRHSDHHRVMTRSYEGLEPLTDAAELPSGYAAALIMALVPPLWRRVMDARARAVMQLQAGTP
jgi:alkane 1-monooxygenase